MNRLESLSNQLSQNNKQKQLNPDSYTIQDEIPQKYQQYHETLKQILNMSLQQQELNYQNNWKYVGEKNGIQGHYKQDQSKNLMYRGQSTLNENIEVLGKLVFNLQDKKHYVEALKQYESLEVINGSMYIAYIRLQSPFGAGISDRDLVTLTGVFKNKENDSIIVVQFSIYYPQKQVPKGVVRAEMKFQTWILQKQDDQNTKITLVGQFDAKGKIPGFIKNQVVKNQGFSINYIKEFLQQNKKNYGKLN